MMTVDERDQLASDLPSTDEARLRACVEVVLFCTQSRKEARQGYLTFYDAFHAQYGKSLRWYQTNTMSDWKTVPGSARDQVHAMLGGREAERPGLLGLEQHSGKTGADATPPSFAFFSEEVKGQSGKPLRRTFVRACLPADISSPSDALLGLLSDGLKTFFPHSGYAGYSCYWNVTNSKLERQVELTNKRILKKYPGVSFGDLFPLQSFIGLGVLQVSWINLISDDLAKKVGGTKKLLGKLPDGLKAMHFKEAGGIAVIAGPKPQIGSLQPSKASSLRHYQAAGHLLTPARLEDRYVEHINLPGLDSTETREWFLRFFGGADEEE